MGTLITTQPDITENNLVEFDLSDAVSSSLVKTQISLKDLEASADIILLVLGQTPYTAFTNGSTIGYGDSNTDNMANPLGITEVQAYNLSLIHI